MPRLVSFLVYHATLGFALALGLVSALLALDVAGLRSLLLASDIKWFATGLFTFFMGLTLASTQMGIAIMRIPYEDNQTRGPRGPGLLDQWLRTELLAPARVTKR